MAIYTFGDIKKLLERIAGDERFIEIQTLENNKLQVKLNRVKHELQRVIRAGGAEISWAQELLDKITEGEVIGAEEEEEEDYPDVRQCPTCGMYSEGFHDKCQNCGLYFDNREGE